MPKISVIIPTHDRPQLLLRAVNSVLNQTYQDFDIIVIDDGIKKPADLELNRLLDKRITYIKNEKNIGAPASRNIGIKKSDAEFIALLDDDDEWLPQKLEKQLGIFDKFGKEVGLVYCGVEIIQKGGQVVERNNPFPNQALDSFNLLLRRNFIFNVTIMARRQILLENLFDEKFPKNQEWDLVLRLAKVTKFVGMSERLVKVHTLADDEHLGGKGNIKNIIKGNEMIVEKFYTDYKKNKEALAFRYFQNGLLRRDNNEFSGAIKDFLKAWKTRPFRLIYPKHLFMAFFGFAFLKFIYKFVRQDPAIFLVDNFKKNKSILNKNKVLKIILWPVFFITTKIYKFSFIQGYLANRRAYLKAKDIAKTLYGDDRHFDRLIKEFNEKKLFLRNDKAYGNAGDFDVLILYLLIRTNKPKIVVETGVASGRSSRVILEALKENGRGMLYSIDLPQYYIGKDPHVYLDKGGREMYDGFIDKEKKPGWLVSENLKNNWKLILGDTKLELPKLLNELEEIDIFFHDSDHSYETMFFEYNQAWPHIRHNGFLVSDDVKRNLAFKDFINKANPNFITQHDGFGIIQKN